jgi:hypothetical protein
MRLVSRRFAVIALSAALAVATLATPGPAPAQSAPPHEEMTPLLLSVHDAPVPYLASDGRMHLTYELWLTNFSSGDATLEKVEVLGDGALLEILDTTAVAAGLQPAGLRTAEGTMPKSSTALLFLDVALAPGAAAPRQLSHRIAARFAAAPPDHQEISETGGETNPDLQAVVVLSPPLRGTGYISADSCCNSTRHRRAALPVNGRVWLSQRFAVDWEQLDANGRIYSGLREKPESYTIFGKQALAVANATVVSITEGQPEQLPGKFPTNIALDQADGNSVILDLGVLGGAHRYALYAHMQPGSIKVKPGDHVTTGQVLGLVGNTGNSLAPHLHFQVMDGPSSLSSNGLPYELNNFQVLGSYATTEEFDTAEAKGNPLAYIAHTPPHAAKGVFPLDKLVIEFAAP